MKPVAVLGGHIWTAYEPLAAFTAIRRCEAVSEEVRSPLKPEVFLLFRVLKDYKRSTSS